jgi:Transposase
MDMTGGYAKSVRQHAPQATICIDPYHVVQLANQALDEIRRAYWNELRSLDDQDTAKRFKDARWSLLKKPEKLTDKQATTLARLKAAGGESRGAGDWAGRRRDATRRDRRNFDRRCGRAHAHGVWPPGPAG